MRKLTKSEKDWLVILLLFVLGAVSYGSFRYIVSRKAAAEKNRFTEQTSQVPRAPQTPLGQQEK